jgi:hypothetical protein
VPLRLPLFLLTVSCLPCGIQNARGAGKSDTGITLPAEGRSFAVRFDDDSFKAGNYFFINRSAKSVVLNLGATELVLEAGEATKSRPTEPSENHYYNITMSERGDAGDKPIATTRWPVANNNRSYVIFLTGPNGKTIDRTVDLSVDAEKSGSKKKKR